MHYKKQEHVICFSGDLKQAALYFDRVIPISLSVIQSVGGDILNARDPTQNQFSEHIPWRFFKDLVFEPDAFVDTRSAYDYYDSAWRGTLWQEVVHYLAKPDDGDWSWVWRKMKQRDLILMCYLKNTKLRGSSNFHSIFSGFLKQMNISETSVLIDSQDFLSDDATPDDLTLTLSGLQLVDTSKATWEQVMELRKDKDRQEKLRDLRLFLYKNYKGESRDFIEDDLNKRLKEYEDACKYHGFDTVYSILSVILDSKCLLAGIAASVSALAFGCEFQEIINAGLIAGEAGLIADIGKFALEVANNKHAFHKIKDSHALAYIIEAKNKLTN